jgi:hypothetical protein
VPVWRWHAVLLIAILIGLFAVGNPAAQDAGFDTDAALDAPVPVLEEAQVMTEAEVAEKRPLRREQARMQYEEHLRRRAGEAPPPEPAADIRAVLDTIPAELLGEAPAEEAVTW